MRSKLALSIVGFVLALWLSSLAVVQTDKARTAILGAVCQSRAAKDRNLAHVLSTPEQAAADRAQIVCLPQECVPTDGAGRGRGGTGCHCRQN